MKKSIKKITALGVSAVLLFSLSACGSDKEDSGYKEDSSYNQTPDESEETNDTSYYSCLTEDGDGLKFNVTPQEFIERYNSLKSSYEDDNYGDLELADFSYIESGTNVNGTSGEAYGCSKTIMGEFSDLIICLNQESNGNSILAVGFGIKNNKWTDMYYSDEMVSKIMTQYELLICAITGCDMSTATNYTVKMLEDDTKATYDRGILFNVDTTYSAVHWYRIQPCTREQYDNALNGYSDSSTPAPTSSPDESEVELPESLFFMTDFDPIDNGNGTYSFYGYVTDAQATQYSTDLTTYITTLNGKHFSTSASEFIHQIYTRSDGTYGTIGADAMYDSYYLSGILFKFTYDSSGNIVEISQQ